MSRNGEYVRQQAHEKKKGFKKEETKTDIEKLSTTG